MNRAIALAVPLAIASCGDASRSVGERTPAPSGAAQPGDVAAAVNGPGSGLVEVFPHVRVDRAARLIEIDGTVPVDVHDPETPDVYLEVTVCTRDSKEHESLVMTDAKPSHVHAALLMLGLEPGAPGSVVFDAGVLRRVPPAGPGLDVRIAYTASSGERIEAPASDWVRLADGGPLAAPNEGAAWIFAGSRIVSRGGREWYDADGMGTLIGLTTFGGETIAWRHVYSPESSVDEPEWLADPALVPAFGTPVVVRISPAG